MPSAGRIVLVDVVGRDAARRRPHSPARTRTLTSMLIPRPKKALRSPRVQRGRLIARSRRARAAMEVGPSAASSSADVGRPSRRCRPGRRSSAGRPRGTPGSRSRTQSSSTRHSKPRSLASRTVVCTQTSVVTPVTIRRRDAAVAQQQLEVGGVERALAGLVEHDLARQRARARRRCRGRTRRGRGSGPSGRGRRCRCRAGRARAWPAGSRCRSGRWPSRVWTTSIPLARGRRRAPRCSGSTTRREQRDVVAERSPKPPGSRKSRCMSMTTAPCAPARTRTGTARPPGGRSPARSEARGHSAAHPREPARLYTTLWTVGHGGATLSRPSEVPNGPVGTEFVASCSTVGPSTA